MTTAAGPAIGAGHTCWSYAEPGPFESHARAFLLAGLAAGDQVWYIGARRGDRTAAWLRGVAGARVIPPEDVYDGDEVIDPAGQLALYTAATEQAVADGHAGLRVVADVTPLVRTDAQRAAFARYEYAVGRYMRTAPLRAVCAYDRQVLGDRTAAELACLHEASHGADVPFRLCPGPTSAEAVLTGEMDATADDLFAAVLRHTDLDAAGGEVTLDAGGVTFIDHRSLLALQRYAEPRRMTAVVRTRLEAAGRLAALLDLPRVRVEVVR